MKTFILGALLGIIIIMNADGAEFPFKNMALCVTDSQAENWAKANEKGPRANDAKLIREHIASKPQALWVTSSNLEHVRPAIAKAVAHDQVLPLVVYNIPKRDSGHYSAGGEGSPDSYKKFITALAKEIGKCKTIIELEPDAVPQMYDQLRQDIPIADAVRQMTDQQRKDIFVRRGLIEYAVKTLKSNQNTLVYIDIGHSNWLPAEEAAVRMEFVGIESADGFCLNASNCRSTTELLAYGKKVSALCHGKHLIIDTSRNGNGPWETDDKEPWCNPPGRALGHIPTLDTDLDLVDAFFWIKRPGESDGQCRGGPKAGDFWPEYALGLIRNTK
jgi:endoglucanase